MTMPTTIIMTMITTTIMTITGITIRIPDGGYPPPLAADNVCADIVYDVIPV
jgi:hypothetical protein